MSYASLLRIRLAIAFGEEQSIRILPSVSRVMKAQVGSTLVLTTVRSTPRCSAMYSQYWMLAPPMGSAPIRTPASRIARRSSALTRSSQ